MPLSPRELVATARAQGLAELAKSVDDAQQLALNVSVDCARPSVVMELYARLEQIRIEVEAIRCAGHDAPGTNYSALDQLFLR